MSAFDFVKDQLRARPRRPIGAVAQAVGERERDRLMLADLVERAGGDERLEVFVQKTQLRLVRPF